MKSQLLPSLRTAQADAEQLAELLADQQAEQLTELQAAQLSAEMAPELPADTTAPLAWLWAPVTAGLPSYESARGKRCFCGTRGRFESFRISATGTLVTVPAPRSL